MTENDRKPKIGGLAKTGPKLYELQIDRPTIILVPLESYGPQLSEYILKIFEFDV